MYNCVEPSGVRFQAVFKRKIYELNIYLNQWIIQIFKYRWSEHRVGSILHEMKETPSSHLNHHWKDPTWFKTKQYQNEIHHQLIHHITHINKSLSHPSLSLSLCELKNTIPSSPSFMESEKNPKASQNSIA